ncbi:MAG: ABC transporter ATP-binding protein, partial [Muribaculaceae bacterium]|nr:ABC transporter ATP-binding protein [Muribaculaceae bacterium]
FKERKEFEALEEEIAALNDEKNALEAYFASGETANPEEFAEKSRRYGEIGEIIDEKEMRWLELSEKA